MSAGRIPHSEGVGAVRREEKGGEDEEQAALLSRLNLPSAACPSRELCRVVW